MSTELGRIAALSGRARKESSPLEQQVRKVAWLIAAVAIGVGVAFLPLGVLAGLSWTEASVFAIGLLVANVPEGLLPTITLALAVGVADLAKRGGLVKRLSAIETLGSTDVICTDKTGTLTQNRMRFHSLLDASALPAPDSLRGDMAQILAACSTAELTTESGDPTELALLQTASDWMSPDEFAASPHLGTPGAEESGYQVFRFDPRLRLMTVVTPETSSDGGTPSQPSWALTKGAPEAVLRLASQLEAQGGECIALSPDERVSISARLDELAGQGLRLIACARRQLAPATASTTERPKVERDLTLVGFMALSDPLRDAVPDAVARAHEAGITVHVITGDNGATAAAIASAAGIGSWRPPGSPAARASSAVRVVTGDAVDAMTDADLDQVLASGDEIVFARSTPENRRRRQRRPCSSPGGHRRCHGSERHRRRARGSHHGPDRR
jgi:magnesium-transporting ATPase (P-type)